ncbi:hypothetical protein EVAR_58963_1 [Eumeta japonica]|uniref:Uncharacterized protein n=1 Tax=Eumeta variegata TaxID=151549 RepID=A0A4C1YJY1_EUMVA|nr:hypothetical protein EVAR_58963_1 [Eumeta japonica]
MVAKFGLWLSEITVFGWLSEANGPRNGQTLGTFREIFSYIHHLHSKRTPLSSATALHNPLLIVVFCLRAKIIPQRIHRITYGSRRSLRQCDAAKKMGQPCKTEASLGHSEPTAELLTLRPERIENEKRPRSMPKWEHD